MSGGAFQPSFEDLPQVVPLFPLPGVLLLPGGRLPLNIFEPRYLAMVRDALAGERAIGMIQPREEAARQQLLKLFEVWGPADPITLSARRQLSSLLFS